MRLHRKLVLVLALTALSIPSSAPGDLDERKAQVDRRVEELQSEITGAREKEGVLSSEIEATSERIGALEGELGTLEGRLGGLEQELAKQRATLTRLNERYGRQTVLLRHLSKQHAVAQLRLEERLVELYETADVDELSILLQVNSLTDLLEQLEYFKDIGERDRQVAEEMKRLTERMRATRRRTATIRASARRQTEAIEASRDALDATRDALVVRRQDLHEAQGERRTLLADVQEERHADEEDLEAMLAASQRLAEQIRQAQDRSGNVPEEGAQPDSGSFIWPVQGTLTSTFGSRCLDGTCRPHEGIDIAAPSGTPIVASRAGTVIYAGWLDGYGNIVVLDHGGDVSTAYAHMSAIWVSSGSVAQGQAIGAVGSTGHSTGNHLHFEIRINGTPVDPLGYL